MGVSVLKGVPAYRTPSPVEFHMEIQDENVRPSNIMKARSDMPKQSWSALVDTSTVRVAGNSRSPVLGMHALPGALKTFLRAGCSLRCTQSGLWRRSQRAPAANWRSLERASLSPGHRHATRRSARRDSEQHACSGSVQSAYQGQLLPA